MLPYIYTACGVFYVVHMELIGNIIISPMCIHFELNYNIYNDTFHTHSPNFSNPKFFFLIFLINFPWKWLFLATIYYYYYYYILIIWRGVRSIPCWSFIWTHIHLQVRESHVGLHVRKAQSHSFLKKTITSKTYFFI